MKMNNLYIAALEALEKIQALSPRTHTTVERAKVKDDSCKVIFKFCRKPVKNGSEWEKKQDMVLSELGRYI
jgi:hypothetical protein